MTAYEQALADCNTAGGELERLEQHIQQTQHEYEQLTNTPLATAAAHHDAEQERNRLATNLSNLLASRSRWLKARDHAAHAVQRELERLVHTWHGEVIHQEQQRRQATTSEGARVATYRSDHAQAELERHEQQLETN